MNITKNILKFINILFLFSFFPSLVTGVFLPNLLYAIIVLTNLFFNFNFLKKKIQEFKIFSTLFFLFYLLLIFSSFVSSFVIFSLHTSFLYFSFIIYVFSLIFIFFENDRYEELFLYIGLITFFVLCLDAFYEIYNGSNILNYSSVKGRLAGLFGDRWVIGSYLVRLLILSNFFINFYKINKKIKYFAYLVFFIFDNYFSGEKLCYFLFYTFYWSFFIYLTKLA